MAAAPIKPDYTVGGKYRLVRRIGSGSFGDIYLGINVTNGEVIIPLFTFKTHLSPVLSVYSQVFFVQCLYHFVSIDIGLSA